MSPRLLCASGGSHPNCVILILLSMTVSNTTAAATGAVGQSAAERRVGMQAFSLARPTELVAVVLLLALALWMRLVNLGSYSGLFDEGIRVEQLFLMGQGYRPFRDIFAAQGPLLLDMLYP